MATHVKPPRVQITGAREVDDLSRQVHAVVEKLNKSPLSLDNLANTKLTAFSTQWAALGVDLSQAPVINVHTKLRVSQVSFSCASGIAASQVNYRTFTIERSRGGTVSKIAESDTKNGVSGKSQFTIPLVEKDVGLELQDGDVILFSIIGAGTKPAVDAGTLTLSCEKR
jgi:hypothetical protein